MKRGRGACGGALHLNFPFPFVLEPFECDRLGAFDVLSKDEGCAMVDASSLGADSIGASLTRHNTCDRTRRPTVRSAQGLQLHHPLAAGIICCA
eukprot:scaffold123845_cov33-Tisochrysis_lutea.AAC.3